MDPGNKSLGSRYKKMNGKYYLYYAASQFGKNQSYIGLATATNPEGHGKMKVRL